MTRLEVRAKIHEFSSMFMLSKMRLFAERKKKKNVACFMLLRGIWECCVTKLYLVNSILWTDYSATVVICLLHSIPVTSSKSNDLLSVSMILQQDECFPKAWASVLQLKDSWMVSQTARLICHPVMAKVEWLRNCWQWEATQGVLLIWNSWLEAQPTKRGYEKT